MYNAVKCTHGIKLLECCENILFSNLFKSYGEYEMYIGL